MLFNTLKTALRLEQRTLARTYSQRLTPSFRKHFAPSTSKIPPSLRLSPLSLRFSHTSRPNFTQLEDGKRSRRPPILPPIYVGRWLMASSVLVFGIIVVGGVTRLTESGLSITEWRPITGILPPLSHADWVTEFEKYQATPEFKLYGFFPLDDLPD